MTTFQGHRAALSEYVRAGRHAIDERNAKPIRQIGNETGMSVRTARHWLKVDHYEEWLRWWPTADALWIEMRKESPPSREFLMPPRFDPKADGNRD